MADFRPPLSNPLVLLFARCFMRFAFWWGYYDGIDIDSKSTEKLLLLRNTNAVLCPNHSHNHDPGMIYALRHLWGGRLRFVAAREVFDRWHGLLGWLIQRIGAYSVERQAADRASILTTIATLSSPQYKLVVFPEGELTNDNRRVLPIEPGIANVFLKAASKLAKHHRHAPLYMVPVALQYTYIQDISANLNNALVRIENTLKIDEHSGSLEDRFDRCLNVLIESKRHHYGLSENLPDYGFNELLDITGSHTHASVLLSMFRMAGQRHEGDARLSAGIDVLEKALFTRVTQKGHRRCTVKVGELVDLTQWLPAYRRDRRGTARRLAAELQGQLSDMLATRQAPSVAA